MSFWKSVRKYWTGVLTVPDDDTKKEETKKDKCQEDPQGMIHMDTNFKYDTIMRSIDNKLKDGLPVKSMFSLIVTTKKNTLRDFRHSNLHYKLRCLEPTDKQFIYKHLNYDKLILTVSDSDVLDIFNSSLLPITGEIVRCADSHEYARPGDIICFQDKGYLYVFQYRGDYLTDREILDASFHTSTILENSGPSAMKLNYIRSMMDNNDHYLNTPTITWMDVLKKLEDE